MLRQKKEKGRFGSGIFDHFFGDMSIRRRILYSYIVILTMMLVIAIFILSTLSMLTTRYDTLIATVNDASTLTQIVQQDISNEIWEIVAGKKDFDQGRQYQIMHNINQRINALYQTSSATNREQLEHAERAMETLHAYVEQLGEQIKNKAPVDDNMDVLREIRMVSELVHEQMQVFMMGEIKEVNEINAAIQDTLHVMIIIELVVFFGGTIFAIGMLFSVSRQITKPIEELETFTAKMASGELNARAQMPQVKEFNRLTADLNQMAQKIKALIQDITKEQQKQKKSELRALQAQITPHFLYNTLDTIIWLAEAEQMQDVIAITSSFSAFFRISLSKGKDWIPIRQEIEHIRSYLLIQQIRYRDILTYEIHIEEGMNEKPILKLLLQPLVENALYHGIKNRRRLGHITIKGWQQDNAYCFMVKDDGKGMSDDRLNKLREILKSDKRSSDFGYGLLNVSRRLQLYYGHEAHLAIQSNEADGTTVVFAIPAESGNDGSNDE